MSKGIGLLYLPDEGSPERRDLSNLNEKSMLEILQASVGGYVEVVPLWNQITYMGETHSCIAFCNEEGKLQHLKPNRVATRAWHSNLPPPGLLQPDGTLADVLVGPVIVVFGDTVLSQP